MSKSTSHLKLFDKDGVHQHLQHCYNEIESGDRISKKFEDQIAWNVQYVAETMRATLPNKGVSLTSIVGHGMHPPKIVGPGMGREKERRGKEMF